MRWWVTFYDTSAALLGGVIVTQDSEAEALDYAITNFAPGGYSTAVAERTSDDYPVADDTSKDDTEVTALRNDNGSPRITVVPSSGDLLERRHTILSTEPAQTSATTVYCANSFSQVVGAGVEIDGGDDTIVNINEAGVYAISARLGVESDDADAITLAELAIWVNGIRYKHDVTNPSGFAFFAAAPGTTVFAPSGTQVQVGAYVETSSGTWALEGEVLVIQQVA